MQNKDNKKQNKLSAENLDASKMSGAEILEAVGISDSLTDALVRESDAKKVPSNSVSETESEMQKRIAEIQKKKMEKIRASLAAVHKSDTEPAPEVTDSAMQTKKVKVKAIASSETSAAPVAVAERPAPEPVDISSLQPEPEEEPVQEARPAPEPIEFDNLQLEPEEEEEPEEIDEEEKIPEEAEPVRTAPRTKKKAKSKQKRRSNQGAKHAAIICASCIGVVLAAYFIGALSYKGKFLPRTYVNSLSVAGMTTEQAHDALLDEKEVKDLTLITPKGEKAVFAASDFKAAYTIPSGALNDAASEGNFNWVSKLFKSSEYAVKYDYTYSADDLKTLIQNYDWGTEISQNAKIVRNDSGKFEIQPETLGDKFDTNVLLNYVVEQLNAGKNTINMEESGCYENYRAKVKTTDLQDDLEVYNRYSNCTITFDFDDRKEQVDNDTIISWLLKREDGSFVATSGHDIPLNQDAIAEYVAQLAEKTDTYGKDHDFYATLDGWITVPWTDASCYGWQIDQKATVSEIVDLIDKGDPVVVEPVYTEWGKGYTRQTDDIGTTYIEVDISAQHFWYYRDNELLMDYDVVSGTETMSSRRTPRGICKIVGHAQGVTLGTYAIQGYEQWVDYWMPFNYLGCGFHDLSRGAYGGSIYMYNGSHGCLNMRHSEAKNLYSEIEDNIPVIVHD